MKKDVIIEIICFLFTLLFLYAAGSKLLDLEKFQSQVGKSPLLTNFSGLIVWVIPVSEIIIALMLVFPRFRLLGLYASFSLMVLFTAYIIAILQFGEEIPCSCGGVLQSLSWVEHLIFNIAFILIAIMGTILYQNREPKSKHSLS